MLVTANFFDVVGVPLARGRGFSAEEARAERDPRLAVVSYTFWQRELAADSGVLGRSIMLNGEAYTILGVLAPRLKSVAGLALAPQVYVPVNRSLVPDIDSPDARIVALIGRLKPGQSLEQGAPPSTRSTVASASSPVTRVMQACRSSRASAPAAGKPAGPSARSSRCCRSSR